MFKKCDMKLYSEPFPLILLNKIQCNQFCFDVKGKKYEKRQKDKGETGEV